MIGIGQVVVPVRRKRKLPSVRLLMPSAGSGGSTGTRHGPSDASQNNGPSRPYGGGHTAPVPSGRSSGSVNVTPVVSSGGGSTSYVSPSTVPASHASTGGARTAALSAADQARLQAVQSLAKAQKQIAKLTKADKVKLPKPPKLKMLKQHPMADVKLARNLSSQVKAKPVKPTDAHILQAARRVHRYAETKLPRAKVTAVRAAKAPKPAPNPHAKKVISRIAAKAGGPDAKALAKYDVKLGRKYGVTPSVLFSQQGIESGHGANTGPSTAGAMGDAQFIPSTRQMIVDKYGKKADAYGSPKQTVRAEALLLRDSGYKSSPQNAIYSYNHSTTYVNDVLGGAKQYKALDKLAAKGAGSVRVHAPSRYTKPFLHASQGRTDMGVDFTGTGAIRSIGKAKVLQVGAPGWPNGGAGPSGQGVLYQLLDGPKKGKNVYVYEGVTPTVKAGQTIAKGQQVAKFYPGSSIEIGWADSAGAPLAHATYSEGDVTAPGSHFANFLSHTTGSGPTIKGGAIPNTTLTSGAIPTSGGVTTSGTTPTSVSGSPTASGSTSRSNRARLLAEIEQNRKKAAKKIGTYRKGLATSTPAPSAPSSSSSSSSAAIKLGL